MFSRGGAGSAEIFLSGKTHHALCVLCASAREKTYKLSPIRKVRKGVRGKNKQEHEVPGDLGALAREIKKHNLAEAQGAQRSFGVRKLSPHELLGDLGALARKKTNKLSPRRKARKGVWGKNKINIEIPRDLGDFAYLNQDSSLAKAQRTQRTQRLFVLKNNDFEILGVLGALAREIKNIISQRRRERRNIFEWENTSRTLCTLRLRERKKRLTLAKAQSTQRKLCCL